MASSCSGHHENTRIILRIKRKNGTDVAPEFYSQDETRPIAKRLTSKTGELLSKTSQKSRSEPFTSARANRLTAEAMARAAERATSVGADSIAARAFSEAAAARPASCSRTARP